jgi:hypothetical protein
MRMNRKKPFTEFKNIRVTNDGYQVVITRGKIEFSRLFARHTKKSLRAAQQCRDQLLKELPSKRINVIPRRILVALGLSQPVIGVFRHPQKQAYGVAYIDKTGRRRSRSFSWSSDGEVAAYAEAVAFRKQSIRGAT